MSEWLCLGASTSMTHRLLERVRGVPLNGIVAAIALWVGTVAVVTGQLRHPSLLRNHPAIKYESSVATDPIAELNRKLAAGEVTLTPDSGPSGYL